MGWEVKNISVDAEKRPEYLYLSKEFFDGDDSVLDVKVKRFWKRSVSARIRMY